MGKRYGPLIINFGDPSSGDTVEAIRKIASAIPGLLLPPGKENPPDGHGEVVYYCPAFGIVFNKNRWAGAGEYRIKMCPGGAR